MYNCVHLRISKVQRVRHRRVRKSRPYDRKPLSGSNNYGFLPSSGRALLRQTNHRPAAISQRQRAVGNSQRIQYRFLLRLDHMLRNLLICKLCDEFRQPFRHSLCLSIHRQPPSAQSHRHKSGTLSSILREL